MKRTTYTGLRRAVMLAAVACTAPAISQADATGALQSFVKEVKSARSDFTQTVTAPDGVKKKASSGTFEFERPNRFRFTYSKPFEQVIVGDGQKVWIYDTDLNQVSSRRMTEALGTTPAALLAGASIDKDFNLKPLPDADGLSWVEALPKAADSAFKSVRIGFKGKTLSAVEITDGFAQKSLLTFTDMAPNVSLPTDRFQFKVPPGADVIEQ